MKSPTGKRLIDEVAKETGLSRNVIYKIVMSQFGCLRQTMRSAEPDQPDTFDSVRFPYFGIFRPRMKVFRAMKGIQKYNEERRRRREQRYGTTNDE
jgi:hypothetical protein